MIQSIPSAASSAPGGAVGGASNLTTAGAIPYVVSPGVLGQDASDLLWDPTNDRLQAGNALIGEWIGGATFASFVHNSVAASGATAYAFMSSQTGATYFNAASGEAIRFRLANVDKHMIAATTGNFLVGGTTDGNFRFDIQSSGSSGTSRCYDQTAVTGSTLCVVRAGAGQSGNLQEWQNNAGTNLNFITATGAYSAAGYIISVGGAAANQIGLNYRSGAELNFTSTGLATWTSGTDITAATDLAIGRNAAGILELNNGTAGQNYALLGASTNGGFISTVTRTITGAVTDGYTAGVSLTPTYTAATAQTVTRHNFINLANPVLSGAGPAALTDATVFRFDAAAGTHKAVDAGTTKITPGGVDAWLKININGTLYYVPTYTSKTT
jgi:hypothetical protein